MLFQKNAFLMFIVYYENKSIWKLYIDNIKMFIFLIFLVEVEIVIICISVSSISSISF